MIVKFSRFERLAGLFLLVAIVGAVSVTIGVAIKKGWFSSKIQYRAHFQSADGVFPGLTVQIAGLRAGQVTDVELVSADRVLVEFEVFEKFSSRIREDSRAQLIRPFVIGDKVLEISIGSDAYPVIAKGGDIQTIESIDIMDLVSGKKLGPFIGQIEGLMTNLSRLAEAFADPKRTEAFVKMFDKMEPLIHNMNRMSQEIWYMALEMNRIIPKIRKENPEVGEQMGQLINHLRTISENLSPAAAEVGPKLPKASLRALEALNEAVIILKAMQKNFFLRGNVEDVRAEESGRYPSSEEAQ